MTDEDLINNHYPAINLNYDRFNLRSANDIIRNLETDEVLIGSIGSPVQTYESGFLNLNWINNIYISSPNLGSFDTIFAGEMGPLTSLKRFPCWLITVSK